MPVTANTSAPYAPTATILGFLQRYRERGIPTPLTPEVLSRAGVSDSLIQRTFQALKTLDLITDDGAATNTLEGIRLAPTGEYQQRLQEWLKAAYADIFAFADPLSDTDVHIRDAFRSYAPTGQQERMVSLFLGLCEAAGLRPKSNAEGKPQAARKPIPTRPPALRRPKKENSPPSAVVNFPSQIPAAISGLLQSLPSTSNGWTQEKRDSFYNTFGTVLDFCIPIVAAEKVGQNNDGEGDDPDQE